MITKEDYINYFGVEDAPKNIKRLELMALNELKAIMVNNIPQKDDLNYLNFKYALLEEIEYLNINEHLISSNGSGNYTLGSYSESSSNEVNKTNETISRISPISYDMLLNSGLLYCGI